MSDYDPMIDRVQLTAREALNKATVVAKQASEKINTDAYTARDLILTMTQMVEIAASEGAKLAQRTMTDTPAGLKQVADYSRAVGRRFIKEARGVSLAATAKIDEGTYDVDDVVISLTRLFDHALVGGMEIAQTVLIGPAQFDSNSVEIEVETPPGDAGQMRKFGVVKIGRYGDDLDEIPTERVTFTPAELAADDRKFSITINCRQYPSGVYRGTVEVGGEPIAFDFGLGASPADPPADR